MKLQRVVRNWCLSIVVATGLLAALLVALDTGVRVHSAFIIVDGTVDAAYGPPLASDQAGDGNGNAVMDLLNLYVAQDADYYYLAFTINADIVTTNWGKYIIYVDTTHDTNGATGDAWTRNALVNDPHKPEYGIYSWVDCAYGPSCIQFWRWTGSGWTQDGTIADAALSTNGVTSTIEWKVARSALGNAEEIWLEAWSTGSGDHDNAQDTINDPPEDWNATDWSTTAVLSNATHFAFSGPYLNITTPQEGQHFVDADLLAQGTVSPTTGVTVTVNLNGAALYTPTVNAQGAFSQPLTLVSGSNVITFTAANISDTATLVRRVTYGSAAHDGDIWWGCLGHNTHDTAYRDPFGAQPAGATVTLRLRACAGDLTTATLHVYLHDRGEVATLPMTLSTVITETGYAYWEATATAPPTPTLMYYKFEAIDGSDHDWYVDDETYDGLNGWGHVVDTNPTYNAFRVTVYHPAFTTPDWMKDAVIYQIFPDRFRDGDPSNNVISGTHFVYTAGRGITYTLWNSALIDPRDPASPFNNRWSEDFYGGDLWGIVEKMDELHDLGVTTLYLNPVFWSPSNHKYDTTDYETIDPHLGGETAFTDLIKAAAQYDIAVVLDGVFNHTSSDSLYFDKYSRYPTVGAYEAITSTYYNWYTFNTWPDDYEMWWIYDTLPKLRSDQAAVRDYFWGDGDSSIGGRWIVAGAAP